MCKPGYLGAKCEINVDECASNPCLNGGTCLDQENQFVCQCPSGTRGKFCQLGMFINTVIRFIFHHLLFYLEKIVLILFKSICFLVTDSCSRVVYGNSTRVVSTGVCGNHGTCKVQTQGGFHCTCDPGWTGRRCQTS